MFINKIGQEHILRGMNCQDYGFELSELGIATNFKCVTDGCSQGLHSEVGAKLFCHLFKKPVVNTKDCFEEIFKIFSKENYKDIQNYLLFTILFSYETAYYFNLEVCGDGYIIKQTHDNIIEYEKIDCNNTPSYYAYNYIPKEFLNNYKEGVEFTQLVFSKKDYKNIGIATDGLEYIINSPFKEEFEQLLINKKEFAIRRLINREQHLFKDDITIVF